MTTTTYATAYANAAMQLQAKVCKLLHWTDDQYSEFMYKNGVAYLHWYLCVDDHARGQLERSKKFWSWFKAQWYESDYAFIETRNIEHISVDVRIGMYEYLHCPRALAAEVKPNSIVLSDIKPHD